MMPHFFYQWENEQTINAIHTQIYIYILYIAHKVSDKIVRIFNKQLQFTRPMTKTDITTLHSYIVTSLASP